MIKMMKNFIAIILLLGVFVTNAQDIPYMSGKIDYLQKGDFHLNDSSFMKALNVYEKGLKKRLEDSVVYNERIAAVRALLNKSNVIASAEELELNDQSYESASVAVKFLLFDLESLKSIDGDIHIENNRTGEVVAADSEGIFYLVDGEEYNVLGEKEGYNDILFAFDGKKGKGLQEILLATSEIQKFEIVKVQAGLKSNTFELSDYDFFERTQAKDSADYLIQSIFFGFDEADLPSEVDLAEVAALMEKYDHLKLEIRGFTDSRGGSSYNKQLAKSRIESVVSELVSMDIPQQRLTMTPMGEKNLAFCEESMPCTEFDHAKNRRVDFVLRSDLQNQMQLSMLNE
jgi:outer membrane protein OmpA-like peptidoglycan-associated protein